jgi:hypothetical protein
MRMRVVASLFTHFISTVSRRAALCPLLYRPSYQIHYGHQVGFGHYTPPMPVLLHVYDFQSMELRKFY